ncbi:MAG: hypothetical protein R2804_17935 [Cyclobacteriaceae bacterium]
MSTLQKTVIDQLGNEVKFNYPPQRIISLVPSQTELLYDLELEKGWWVLLNFVNAHQAGIKRKPK